MLASVWDDFAVRFVPACGPFLVSAAEYYEQPLDAILDVACGTGLITRRLASWAESVVGLDLIEAMLATARSRTPDQHVRYIQADFCNFRLGETFDAALRASDSLNYLATPADLRAVFRSVSAHLRRGGLFVLDVLDHRACQLSARRKAVADVGGEQFEIYYFYDSALRVSESRVVFRNGAVERHRRIAIEKRDVHWAATESGLEVVEHFATSPWPFSGGRQFYVLRAS